VKAFQKCGIREQECCWNTKLKEIKGGKYVRKLKVCYTKNQSIYLAIYMLWSSDTKNGTSRALSY
jgi:hypothetical protein